MRSAKHFEKLKVVAEYEETGGTLPPNDSFKHLPSLAQMEEGESSGEDEDKDQSAKLVQEYATPPQAEEEPWHYERVHTLRTKSSSVTRRLSVGSDESPEIIPERCYHDPNYCLTPRSSSAPVFIGSHSSETFNRSPTKNPRQSPFYKRDQHAYAGLYSANFNPPSVDSGVNAHQEHESYSARTVCSYITVAVLALLTGVSLTLMVTSRFYKEVPVFESQVFSTVARPTVPIPAMHTKYLKKKRATTTTAALTVPPGRNKSGGVGKALKHAGTSIANEIRGVTQTIKNDMEDIVKIANGIVGKRCTNSHDCRGEAENARMCCEMGPVNLCCTPEKYYESHSLVEKHDKYSDVKSHVEDAWNSVNVAHAHTAKHLSQVGVDLHQVGATAKHVAAASGVDSLGNSAHSVSHAVASSGAFDVLGHMVHAGSAIHG